MVHVRKQSSRPEDKLVLHSIIAGSVSGMTSTVAMYPLDLLRTKMQAAHLTGTSHHGPMQTLRSTLQHGGVRALYTGLSLPLAAQAVYKATVFTVNNLTQRFIVDWKTLENHRTGIIKDGTLTNLDRFLSGMIGGGVNALLFVTPVEFVRNQLIAQHSRSVAGDTSTSPRSTWQVIRYSVRDHGVTSLWRGASWSVARDSFGCGCFFLTMAATQKHLTPVGEAPSFATTILSGGLAGLAFWVTGLPLDTVKTWIQSTDLSTHVSPRHAVAKILHQEGPSAVVSQLFRGWQVAYGRGMPSAAITISVYSMVFQQLQGSMAV